MPPWAFSCRHLLVYLSVQINACVMMIFKMIHAKYSLKFCAIGLYFISIVTCLPTVSALAQASDYETCLLSVSKVTPLYISLWTAAVLSAPKSLENIKIIYAYPRDAVDVEKMTERNTDNWLVGEIDNDRQLVIGRPSSQENYHSWFERSLSESSESNGFNNIVSDSQIQALSDSVYEKVYWTSKLRWQSAINWATHNKQVLDEKYSQTDVNSNTETALFKVLKRTSTSSSCLRVVTEE